MTAPAKQPPTPQRAAHCCALPTYTIQQAAKMLGIGPNKLFELLRSQKILNDANYPYQRYIDQGYLKVQCNNREQQGVGLVFYARTRVTNKGMEWLNKVIHQEDV